MRLRATLCVALIGFAVSGPRAASWGDPAPAQAPAPPSGWGAPAAPKPPAPGLSIELKQSVPRPAAAPASAPAPAVTLSQVVPPKITAIANGIALDNLTLVAGPVTYRIPHAEMRGTSLSVAEVGALLDPAATMPLADRLARLSADEIVMPQILADAGSAETRQTTTYRDILMSGAKAGRIASVTAAGGVFASAADPKSGQGTFDRLSITDIDLGLAAAIYTGAGGGERPPARRLYGAVSIEGIALSDRTGTTTRVARIASGEVLARPSVRGLAAGAALFSTGPADRDGADPDQRRRVLAGLTEVFDSFDLRAIEMTGFAFANSPDPKDAGRIGRLAYTAATPERPSEIRMEDLDAGSEDGRMRIGAFALEGLGLRPFLDAAVQGGATDPASLRALVPAMGTLRVAGLAFDAKAGSDNPAAPSFTVGGFEIRADKPVDGVPSDLHVAMSDVVFPVSPGSEGFKDLADLGFTRLTASMGFAARWNEAGRQIVLRDLSLRSPEMGSVTLSGLLGNVSRDVFDRDSAVATVALLGASATALDVTIQNAGLFERIVARQAARERRSPEDLRREWGVAASIGVPMMLGASPSSKALGAALARFVAKPGRLSVQARTRGSDGLTLADVTGTPDPMTLLGRLDITASAE